MADIALSVATLSSKEYGLIYEEFNVFINDFATSPFSSGITALDIGIFTSLYWFSNLMDKGGENS